MTLEQIAETATDRNATIAALRAELKRRTGRSWSVTGGRGTAWGWIRISAPPARLGDFGTMTADDLATLSAALGKDVHHQGESVPASREYRREYLERAAGLPVTAVATPYWD